MIGVLTEQQAADLAGVSTETVRSWVKRGHLSPVAGLQRVGLRRFHEDEVILCWRQRQGQAYWDRLDRLADEWRETCSAAAPKG